MPVEGLSNLSIRGFDLEVERLLASWVDCKEPECTTRAGYWAHIPWWFIRLEGLPENFMFINYAGSGSSYQAQKTKSRVHVIARIQRGCVGAYLLSIKEYFPLNSVLSLDPFVHLLWNTKIPYPLTPQGPRWQGVFTQDELNRSIQPDVRLTCTHPANHDPRTNIPSTYKHHHSTY